MVVRDGGGDGRWWWCHRGGGGVEVEVRDGGGGGGRWWCHRHHHLPCRPPCPHPCPRPPHCRHVDAGRWWCHHHYCLIIVPSDLSCTYQKIKSKLKKVTTYYLLVGLVESVG